MHFALRQSLATPHSALRQSLATLRATTIFGHTTLRATAISGQCTLRYGNLWPHHTPRYDNLWPHYTPRYHNLWPLHSALRQSPDNALCATAISGRCTLCYNNSSNDRGILNSVLGHARLESSRELTILDAASPHIPVTGPATDSSFTSVSSQFISPSVNT